MTETAALSLKSAPLAAAPTPTNAAIGANSGTKTPGASSRGCHRQGKNTSITAPARRVSQFSQPSRSTISLPASTTEAELPSAIYSTTFSSYDAHNSKALDRSGLVSQASERVSYQSPTAGLRSIERLTPILAAQPPSGPPQRSPVTFNASSTQGSISSVKPSPDLTLATVTEIPLAEDVDGLNGSPASTSDDEISFPPSTPATAGTLASPDRDTPASSPASASSATASSQPDEIYHGDQQTVDEALAVAKERRERLLPLLENADKANDRRSSTSRHRNSLRSSISASPTTSTPGRVPPIRSFRSSGSRQSSLGSDMSAPMTHNDAPAQDAVSVNNDNTLRAGFATELGSDANHTTPPGTARPGAVNGEDGGDLFLKIARDEASRETEMDRSYRGSYTPNSTRSPGHRRPLSTNFAYYTPISPPKLRRRLSDQQQERPDLQQNDDQSSQVSRSNTFRSTLREKAASTHPAEELSRMRGGGVPLRQSPAPRSPVYQEDALRGTRRRASVTDSTPPVSGRQYKSGILGYGHSRTYSSSPLVQSLEARSQHGANLMDGTESTTSTTAPSTVWDELDDLKSRIHRLELTGKLPATSAAAVARLADDRPPTATTATTASLSPKRQAALQIDTQSTVSAQPRDLHPLLLTALTKSKDILSNDVYRALETAAHDALGLSQMMGTASQPGPISGGASTVGSTVGVTDRQLRRKADSVCRSLTELCLALNDSASQPQSLAQLQRSLEQHRDAPMTPTARSTVGFSTSRRASITGDSQIPSSASRPLSKFEERRHSLLQSSAPPVSLYTNSHLIGQDTPQSRRSSLLISRTRRGQTEEPEEGRESPFLRTRRAETEEPEDGRRTSFLVRNRRGSVDNHDDARLGSPVRSPVRGSPVRQKIGLNMAGERSPESQAQSGDADSITSSGLSRRRFVSDLHSRATASAGPMASTQRRYLERSTPDRELGTRTPDASVRRFSLHGRANSLGSRLLNREATAHQIPPPQQYADAPQ